MPFALKVAIEALLGLLVFSSGMAAEEHKGPDAVVAFVFAVFVLVLFFYIARV